MVFAVSQSVTGKYSLYVDVHKYPPLLSAAVANSVLAKFFSLLKVNSIPRSPPSS